jgi:hypothetical protein
MPSIGCSCTGAIARRAEKVGYGSSRKAESAGSNGTGSLRLVVRKATFMS